MKKLLISAAIIAAVAGQLAAQANYPGNVVIGSIGTVLVPRVSSPNWWGQSACGRGPGRHGDNLFPYWGYACDPLYGDNAGDDDLAPIITVAIPQMAATPEPAPPPSPPKPPPPPVRSEVHEYHWPSSASDSSTTTFSIITKDGRVQSAIAVWVQDDVLCYIMPDGGTARMEIDSIDRRATRQRNAENHLTFWLPPEEQAESTVAIAGSSR